MGIAIKKLFAELLFWLYDFIDAVFECFEILCGTQDVSIDGSDMSLIEVFLEHDTVTQVFLCIILLSVVVAAVCTATSIVKSVVNMKGGERKSHAKSLGQGFAALLITLAMTVILLTFIGASNTALAYVQKSFNSSYGDMNFSSMLFDMSVESSYVYEETEDISYVEVYDEVGNPVLNEDGTVKTEIEYDSDGNIVYVTELVYVESGYAQKSDGTYYTAADIDFSTMTVDQVFGVHKKTLGLFESETKGYTTEPMVYLETFNLFTAYLVVIVMLVVIIWSMLGLVRRVFDIVFLFLTMPLITATIPLDDGARFKTWRDTVTSKILLAWGAVFAMNIFMLFIPIISQIDLGGILSDTGAAIFKIFLIMGSALAVNSGQVLAARLMGTDASESREMAHSARTLIGGLAVGGSIVRNAGTRLFGGKNKNGKEYEGLVPAVMTRGAQQTDQYLQGRFGDKYINSRLATGLHKIGGMDPGVLNALRAESYGKMYGDKENGNNAVTDLAKNITSAPKDNPGAFRDNNNNNKK